MHVTPTFVRMLNKQESMREGHLVKIVVSKHRIALNPRDVPPIRSALYRASPMQSKLECEEVEKMREAGVSRCARQACLRV